MKQLIIKYSISLSLILFMGCSESADVSPSQNSALNKVSSSSTDKNKGSLQNLLNNFIKDDWEPTVSKDAEIQKKYMYKVKETNTTEKDSAKYVEKENKPFTLQEYADKRAAYVKAHPADHNNSNVHKLEMMPVIGNSRKR